MPSSRFSVLPQPQDNKALLQHIQTVLSSETARLFEQFEAQVAVELLLQQRSQLIDDILQYSFRYFFPQANNLSLIAVGGYGRQELLPYSDIDLLLLADETALIDQQAALEQFITTLWDTGLKIGHSVRTLTECIEQARLDITVMTNLLESRLISGDQPLYQQLKQVVKSHDLWPSPLFFAAKRDEQIARHRKYSNNEYRLEPNIKSSPGGLRDIQMIGWIAKRHFALERMADLVEQGFLTAQEYDIMRNGQNFLMKIRFALHMLYRRDENRLSFEQQEKIANYFSYQQQSISITEQLMKDYYRWAQTLGQLNDLIMQLFEENIVRSDATETLVDLNPRFRLRNNQIETHNERTFIEYPSALLEIFVLMAKHKQIIGVRANTIRQLRECSYLIDDAFRQDSENKRLFIELLRSPYGVASRLNLMRRYGILGQYIPAFGEIIGQMQHDLFHIYTVDAHTLQVLKNARKLVYSEATGLLELASQVAKFIEKKDLLYLACLFHDIGKGRGGDHSTLGAADALEFCLQHGYNPRDSQLVSWLVQQHLLMSQTAQKKDLTDPEVIRQFAIMVSNTQRLDYLFVLTVADISGTNPSLWNSWRASLMQNLYNETKRALHRGLENSLDKQEIIEEKQQLARQGLDDIGTNPAMVELIWSNAGEDYFLHENVDDIIWQTKAIVERIDDHSPLVLIQQSSNPLFKDVTQIFIHTKDRPYLFATVVATLEFLQLTVLDAKIYSSISGYALDTFMVLDENKQSIHDHKRLQTIQQTIEYYLQHAEQILQKPQRRAAQHLKHLNFATQTRMSLDQQKNMTILEVIAIDRPGLLATIGRIFVEFDLELHNAKITTLGDRVEDIFFITQHDLQPLLDEQLCVTIQQTIRDRLDQQLSKKT